MDSFAGVIGFVLTQSQDTVFSFLMIEIFAIFRLADFVSK
jgi:hypothetical protein